MEEEQAQTIEKYRQPLIKDLPFLYILGIISASGHLALGIIYQQIILKSNETTNFTFPNTGGYIALVAIAFMLIYTYFLLLLRQQPQIPKYIRRFCVTLSIIVLVAHSALIVILCIRANDFRVNKQQLNEHEYGIVIAATVLDILFSIAIVPLHFYVAYVNRKSLQLTPDDIEEEEREQHERGTEARHQSRREEQLDHEAEVPNHPQTNNRLHQIPYSRKTEPNRTPFATQQTIEEAASSLQNENLKKEALNSEIVQQDPINNP